MPALIEQTAILEDIARILHAEAGGKYDLVRCEFKPFGDGRETTMITTFFVTRQGIESNYGISDDPLIQVTDLAVDLRRIMQENTDGSWNAFRMSINEQGRANVKFDYD